MIRKLRLVYALLCGLMLCACAAPAANVVVSSPLTEERVLTDVRTQYRNASLIVAGICEGSHVDAQGATCYDLSVTDIYAGNAGIGDTIHCTAGAMNTGERYLLFLGNGEDVNHAEDMTGFTLLSDGPLPIMDSEVIWDGKRLALSALQAEINQLSTVISAPAPVYYYDSFSSLADAAEEIFIGRVVNLPEMTSQSFSIRNGGAVEKTQCNAAVATIEAYGSIKGALGYGQRIQMVYSPENVSGMLDAATLQHMEFTVGQTPRLLEDNVYVFFLLAGPDAKQTDYFPVNPVQGFVALSGDDLSVCTANTPLRPYRKLTPLVQALQSELDQYSPQSESPALVVEE